MPDSHGTPGTPRRRVILDLLRDASAPLGVNEVAERAGVHPNTVRFHLDALVAQGAVDASLEKPAGPGRPRTVYEPRPGMDRGGPRGYHLLARVLLSRLASTGPGAAAAATEAGRGWGRYLVDQPPPFHRMTEAESIDRLTGLLAELGFGPEAGPVPEAEAAVPEPAHDRGRVPGRGTGRGPETGRAPGRALGTRRDPGTAGRVADRREDLPARLRLRHCPFLEMAEEFGQLVCPLHLGLMQGALTELRAPVEATGLEPFAEPDVCLVHLAAAV